MLTQPSGVNLWSQRKPETCAATSSRRPLGGGWPQPSLVALAAASNHQSSACPSGAASASRWAGFHTISTAGPRLGAWPGPLRVGRGLPLWREQSTHRVGTRPLLCGLDAGPRNSLRELPGGTSTGCCRVTSDPPPLRSFSGSAPTSSAWCPSWCSWWCPSWSSCSPWS